MSALLLITESTKLLRNYQIETNPITQLQKSVNKYAQSSCSPLKEMASRPLVRINKYSSCLLHSIVTNELKFKIIEIFPKYTLNLT